MKSLYEHLPPVEIGGRRLGIADLAGGDGARDTGTGGLHTIDGLHGESLGDGVGIGAGRANGGVGAIATALRERTASGVAVGAAAGAGTEGQIGSAAGTGRGEISG